MNIWDFLHAHADGVGALIVFALFGFFLIWFTREVNK